MASEEAVQAVQMVRAQRWCALATSSDEGPLASMVTYATEPGLEILMFLSRLARHTRNLDATPAASVVISAADQPDLTDPQTLARVSLQGTVVAIERDDPEFAAAWRRYLDRLPAAAPRLGLGDFTLYRLTPDEARFVGGFGGARTIKKKALREAAAESL